MQSIFVIFMAVASLLYGTPAQANSGPTVDAHEWEQVSFHPDMPMSRVHRIFDTKGVEVVIKPPNPLFQERRYPNACHTSSVNITYIFKGRWVVYNWDAYYPHSYPDFSHSCLYPHPND